jgi:translocation and assembly module TamB
MKVRAAVFNGEVSANLDLSGTLKEPVSIGNAEINSGIVRFPFATFEVKSGYVTLSRGRPYEPQLRLLAESRQFGYDINMQVSGSAEAPILQFTSNPPLNYEQVLLLVTAGELPREERILTTQQRAQTVAMFLGRDLLSRLGYGDQAEQRLLIQSGEQLTQEGTPTYRIEYKLSDRWSVTGEYDRFNDYNMGLKWRVYQK